MKKKDKILLWIPMYNCERQIVRVLEQLKGESEKYIDKVILVNNRSADHGEQAVIKYLDNNQFHFPVELLRNDKNYGLGGSHKVAFQYAITYKFDYIITLHGDDQGHISDILPWIKNGIYKRYDCLLGSRFLKSSRLVGYSKFRTFGNQVYNVIFSFAVKKRIYDLGAGLNMYKVDMLRDYHYMKFADNLTFNYFGVLALHYYHQTYRFFPLVWSEDDQVSNVKMCSQAVSTLGMVIRFICNEKKFFEKDHRENKVKNYTAKTVYTTENILGRDKNVYFGT